MTKITKRAVIVSGILLIWFVGHSFFKKPEESKKITRSNKQAVRFRNIPVQSFDEAVNVRGYTKAWRSACIRARTSGEVEKIHVVSGQKVKENQLLVELSDDSRFERLAKAKHDVKAKKLEYEALEKLGSMQYHSLSEVANKKTLYYAALLEEKQAKLDLEYSKIRAPFSGVVGNIYLNEGASVSVATSTAIISIAELDPMKVSVFCSNKDISKIQVGQDAILDIDGISEKINGAVTAVSHVADSKTRNYEVEVKISNHDLRIADGMTVNCKIAVGVTSGFFIPSSSIVLSDDGAPGIKVITGKNRVKFVPIKIVSTQNDGTWVSGPDMGDLKLITVGHEYVIDGAEVAAVPE